MACERLCDGFFALYFVIHFALAVIYDSQTVLPAEWYPSVLRNALLDYARMFKDNMVLKTPAWYASIIVCELCLQIPFLLVATYAFVKGGCRWIRLPSIIYGVHTATAVLPIIAHVMFNDFSKDKHPGPSTKQERLKLAAMYGVFLVIPLLLVLRMLVSDFYCGRVKETSTKPAKQKKKKA